MASASTSSGFTEDALKKRKAIILISMNDERSRRKAREIAVRARGVESVESTTTKKNELAVVGVGVNWHNLMAAMNTKIGPATLVKMTEIRRGWGVLRKLYKPIVSCALLLFLSCSIIELRISNLFPFPRI